MKPAEAYVYWHICQKMPDRKSTSLAADRPASGPTRIVHEIQALWPETLVNWSFGGTNSRKGR